MAYNKYVWAKYFKRMLEMVKNQLNLPKKIKFAKFYTSSVSLSLKDESYGKYMGCTAYFVRKYRKIHVH